jgi:hypothetical protein
MTKQPTDNDRYGPDRLLADEVFSLPEKERKSYLKNMEVQERSRLIGQVFLRNLNENVRNEELRITND